jgi:hypothetical protein
MARKTKTTVSTVKPRGGRARIETATAEVEADEGGVLTFEDGIVITTTLLLLGAVILAWMASNGYA